MPFCFPSFPKRPMRTLVGPCVSWEVQLLLKMVILSHHTASLLGGLLLSPAFIYSSPHVPATSEICCFHPVHITFWLNNSRKLKVSASYHIASISLSDGGYLRLVLSPVPKTNCVSSKKASAFPAKSLERTLSLQAHKPWNALPFNMIPISLESSKTKSLNTKDWNHPVSFHQRCILTAQQNDLICKH